MDRPESSRDTIANFIRYLNELKAHVHQKLTTTVEDEAANRTQLHDLGEKERQTEESRDALQAKLNEVREEKEKVTFGLDQGLRKLQFELHDLTHLNKVETEAVNREMSEAITKATADHELRMKQLTDQVEGLERQLTEVMDRNKEEEQRLRKEKSRAEAALSSRITQYDEDMLARQDTISNLEVSLTEEAKEYAVLKEYFDKVDADLNRQSEEQDIIDAVNRRLFFAVGVMEKAAVRIQSCIRAKIARVEVEKLRSKSKKGKKGKKGKK
jgi:chromosome segregation ATPase